MTKFENRWGSHTREGLARKQPKPIGRRLSGWGAGPDPPTFSIPVILQTYPLMKMVQSVPKRWYIKFRRRGITQKKSTHHSVLFYSITEA